MLVGEIDELLNEAKSLLQNDHRLLILVVFLNIVESDVVLNINGLPFLLELIFDYRLWVLIFIFRGTFLCLDSFFVKSNDVLSSNSTQC